jgi:hypothetical protein
VYLVVSSTLRIRVVIADRTNNGEAENREESKVEKQLLAFVGGSERRPNSKLAQTHCECYIGDNKPADIITWRIIKSVGDCRKLWKRRTLLLVDARVVGKKHARQH